MSTFLSLHKLSVDSNSSQTEAKLCLVVKIGKLPAISGTSNKATKFSASTVFWLVLGEITDQLSNGKKETGKRDIHGIMRNHS